MPPSYERDRVQIIDVIDLYKSWRNNGRVHALDILGDPVRRRILELLADGERSAGEIGEVVQREFGISQPAVSQHLRVLRESGFTTVRPDGTRRLYAVDSRSARGGGRMVRPVPPLLAAAPRRARHRARTRAPCAAPRCRGGEQQTARRRPNRTRRRPNPTKRRPDMVDVTAQIEAVTRESRARRSTASPARVQTLAQTYPSPIDDVWDAVTSAERIPRWFLPGVGRPASRRALPARGQRRRRGPGVRAAERTARRTTASHGRTAAAATWVTVRLAAQCPRTRPARARAHRAQSPMCRTSSGRVRPGRHRDRLGRRLPRTRAAPRAAATARLRERRGVDDERRGQGVRPRIRRRLGGRARRGRRRPCRSGPRRRRHLPDVHRSASPPRPRREAGARTLRRCRMPRPAASVADQPVHRAARAIVGGGGAAAPADSEGPDHDPLRRHHRAHSSRPRDSP